MNTLAEGAVPSSPPATFVMHECVGRGGFGEVYRATLRDDGGERDVAVKVLLRQGHARAEAVLRLRDEGRILHAIRHPSILGVHDLLYLEGRLALVMEYVDGQDLSACMASAGPLPPRVAVEAIGQVADALHTAWSTPGPDGSPLHLLHRDIKPANIRVGRDGVVKLLDFGIARADSVDREARTGTDNLVGSYLYMAPERFLDHDLLAASDVFSLGCTFFELLMGRRLFANQTLRDTYTLVLERSRFDTHVSTQLASLDTTPELRQLVTRILSYAHEGRPGAQELAKRCAELAVILPGPSLSDWTEARAWPAMPSLDGPLTGRTLVSTPLAEGDAENQVTETLAGRPVLASENVAFSGTFDAHPRPRPRGGWAVWLLGLSVLVVLATAGTMALLSAFGIGGVLYATSGEAIPVEPAESIPPTTLETGPDQPALRSIGEEEPELAPEVLPDPEVPLVGADPPPPDEPEPVEPEAPATGTVRDVGRVAFTLERGGKHNAPGEIVEGRYTIFADFGAGSEAKGSVVVKASEVVKVKCHGLFQSCSVVP